MYCDGGMCNDFPMNALPEDEQRIGLMVRPVDWIQHHISGEHKTWGEHKMVFF